MARGVDQRYNSARIVSLEEYKRRTHPTAASGGGGKKPPKPPKTRTGGGGERPEEPEDQQPKKGNGRSPFDKFIGKVFPGTEGYDIESQPNFYGNAGRLSDFNPKNNPYMYKKKKDKDGE